MSYVMPPGLGQSIEEFTRRRQASAWARRGTNGVEGTAGRGWVKPGAWGENGDGDAVNGGLTVVPEPVFAPAPELPSGPIQVVDVGEGPMPAGGWPATPVVFEPSQPVPEPVVVEEPTFTFLGPTEPEPARPVFEQSEIPSAPVVPLVDITVQLRNSGNLNAPGANTNLRFSMPGLGGSLCAVGAAVRQLPAGTKANTYLLGEWFLTGEWGGALGCSFTAHSASQGRAVVAETEIPAQETPYTPGADYCPPGQIPKADGSGCYEPCPMRSQEYNEVTGECEDISCPPGTIIGAYGECVTLVQTDAGPVGVPYVPPPEPDPDAAGQAQPVFNGIDIETVVWNFPEGPVPYGDPLDLGPGGYTEEQIKEFSPDYGDCPEGWARNNEGDCVAAGVIFEGDPLVTCAPGWGYPATGCDTWIGDPSEWGPGGPGEPTFNGKNGEEGMCGPGYFWSEWAYEDTGDGCLRITEGFPIDGGPGPDDFNGGKNGNGYGNGYNGEDPWGPEETKDEVFFNGNGLTVPLDPGGPGVGPIVNGGPYGPTGPTGPGPGPGPNGEQPLLSPGVEGDGFGILQVGLGLALAWVLAQSYARAPR